MVATLMSFDSFSLERCGMCTTLATILQIYEVHASHVDSKYNAIQRPPSIFLVSDILDVPISATGGSSAAGGCGWQCACCCNDQTTSR